MIERIDAHHHLWEYRADEYAWIDDSKATLKRDFAPSDIEPELHQAGVTGTVVVQARQSLAETWTLLEHAAKHSFIKGVVGWIPLSSPDLERFLPTVASDPRLKGVRHVLHDEPDDDYMLREDFNRGIAALKPFRLVYDVLIFERHLPQTLRFVDRHPEQVFVIDHIAKPRIKAGVRQPWADLLRELAERPHVHCKISGVATEADHTHWTESEIRPYIEHAIEAFGAERTMFGSDWPVCTLAVTYAEWVSVIARAISGLSTDEQARIWSGTAREVYHL